MVIRCLIDCSYLQKNVGKPYNVADDRQFLTTPLWGKSAPRGLTIVLLGRWYVPIGGQLQTTAVSGTIRPQFAMQVLTGGCEPTA